jgi:septum site-determining protein MinD
MALLVTTPEVSAVRDVDRVIGLLEAAGKRNPKLIINRVKPELVERGEMLGTEDILQILAIDLIGIVPEDDDMVAYTNRGEPAILSNKSLAGKAFHNIVRRLEGQEVDFLPLNGNRGFLKGLRRLVKLG